MLAYLSRSTHRVAISNSRLVALDERGVTFRWKDYRVHGATRYKTMSLSTDEFICAASCCMYCPAAFIASATMGCLPTPVASNTSPPLANCCISPHRCPLPTQAIPAPQAAALGPPSSASTAVRRCSSSRPSRQPITFGDRRQHDRLAPRALSLPLAFHPTLPVRRPFVWPQETPDNQSYRWQHVTACASLNAAGSIAHSPVGRGLHTPPRAFKSP